MGQTRASSRKRSKVNKSSPGRKELAGYPVEMTEEKPGLDQLAGGPTAQTNDSLETAIQIGPQSPASNMTHAESASPASELGSGPTTTASAPHADSAMFTEQLHRLRARLQSVVQGVREVAQSLDEPHSLIANVRDQLQSRHDSARRNSLCSVPTAGFDSASRRNSLASVPPAYNVNAPVARNSSGGVGGLPGAIPAPDSMAMPATLEAATATAGCGVAGSSDDGSGDGNWSVKARVAAVELRSMSGGGSGLSEPLPLLQPHGLPMVLERNASMRVVGDDGIEVDELEEEEEEEASPVTPPRRAHPVSSGTDSCSAHAAASALPGPKSARCDGGGDGAALQGVALSQRFDGVPAAATTGSSGATSPVKSPVMGSGAGSVASSVSVSSGGAKDGGAVAAAPPTHSAAAARSSEEVRSALSRSSSRGGGGRAGSPYSNGGNRAAVEAAAAAVAAADLVAANAVELLGPRDAGLLAATANAAAAEAYLRDHPETLRELWTLRARVRGQEGELATMVKQLSTKNAQLDQAQVTVQAKEKELSALTERLTGVLARLQSFQLAHHHQQQELHALQRVSLGASPSSSPMAAATSPRALWTHSPGAMTPNSYINPLAIASGARAGSDNGSYGGADVAATAVTPPQLPAEAFLDGAALARGPSGRGSSSAAMGFAQHRVFSLRDAGPSLEVSLPPPPSLWSYSGPDVSSTGEEPTQTPAEGASSDLGPSSVGTASIVNSSPTDVADIALYPVASSITEITTEITTAPRVLFTNSSIQHASPAAAPSTTAHAPGPGTAPGALPVMCEERPGDSASDSGSATGAAQRAQRRRRRGLLGLLLQMAPSVACVALLMRDEGVRQRLEQVRRGLATAGSYRSLDAQRVVASAAAAARSAPLDVGRYLRRPQQGSKGGDSSSNNVEAFESQTTRECKATWCSIIRPPPTQAAADYY